LGRMGMGSELRGHGLFAEEVVLQAVDGGDGLEDHLLGEKPVTPEL